MTSTMTRTAGVDLAAGSLRTALAVIAWSPGGARLESLQVDVEDEAIVAAAPRVERLGIDCALGWPDEFVAFVARHADHEAIQTADGGMDWRRTLAYRETDRHVREVTGRWPLSVSTDRLGLTAMRCAGLLARLAAEGCPVDRSGRTGAVAEVYPGATLRLWGWEVRGYRTDAAVRRGLVTRLGAEAPWLDLAGREESMAASCDAFDAVVAALSARAVSRGGWTPPPPEHFDRARREGWVALPTIGLSALVDAPAA